MGKSIATNSDHLIGSGILAQYWN